MSPAGMRFAVLVLVAVVWCRGTFGQAAVEKIQIFNVHVDEYATKVIVTWETDVRTDSKIRYGLKADEYTAVEVSAEQKSETIHSITIERLKPDTTHHYRIIARDSKGVLPEVKSEDLQFRTAKTDSIGNDGKENAGLVNLTKSYVDKLTQMTPDERERLKSSIQKYSGPAPAATTGLTRYRGQPTSGAGTIASPSRRKGGRPLPMIAPARPAESQARRDPAAAKVQPLPGAKPTYDKDGYSKYGYDDREEPSGDAYDTIHDNAFVTVEREPLSTFSIDVDTASYSLVRSYLTGGSRPPKDAVRIEELINSFTFSYPAPDEGETLAVHAEVVACPWKPAHKLLKVGMKGREIPADKRPPVNLVFLIDVSGSMNGPERLPLVIQSLQLLLPSLSARDRVSIVVYAGASGLVLPPTPGDQHQTIKDALNRLQAGGSTNGGAGLQLAYSTAKDTFLKDGTNRVMLATDGDFNVGMSSRDALVGFVAEKAKEGVFLTVLGYGMGNYKDRVVEQLADKGNGHYAYIDALPEARKVLVEQAGGTLHTIAKDVKLQLEFNPKQVQAYRLIGYENRLLAAQDFNDDTKDAGELGSGHTVTALYELVPPGAPVPAEGAPSHVASPAPAADPLRYQKLMPSGAGDVELLTVKLRYKQPKEDKSRALSFRVGGSDAQFEKASVDMRFAAAVAGFGMILRESAYKGDLTLDAVAGMAESALGADPGGQRTAFLKLVNRARIILK